MVFGFVNGLLQKGSPAVRFLIDPPHAANFRRGNRRVAPLRPIRARFYDSPVSVHKTAYLLLVLHVACGSPRPYAVYVWA